MSSLMTSVEFGTLSRLKEPSLNFKKRKKKKKGKHSQFESTVEIEEMNSPVFDILSCKVKNA